MGYPEEQQSGGTEHGARSEYPVLLPRNDAPANFDRAIKLLCPPGNHGALVALFDGRAQWDTIRDWRRGRRGIPQWALELLASRLDAAASPLVNACEHVRAIKPGRGKAWKRRR